MRDDRPQQRLRCAVYTRKSTEDGLEQEFNSLDAQYEACTAYIMSQRHEGWTLLPDRYDDGGFSGGNMERPGLKRLLADVAAGKVDVIVLYKIDRLTRSLADFAKIVEILDAAKASFVSVTQAFNTTTSMGRLMLNVLLSFAQFEREVTGERIRDKIAASKKKGLWMGGPVPLGYIVRDRKLVVHEKEAEALRHIMRRYLAVASAKELAAELDAHGYRTKVQQLTSGSHRGGCAFRRGTLNYMLANRIYLGEIVHKGVAHPGEHEAIVPIELWEAVQAKLAFNAKGGARRLRVKSPSLLIGLMVDGLDRPMTPSHSKNGTRRYRYYVTRPDHLDDAPPWRVAGRDVETLVSEQIAAFLRDQNRLYSLIAEHVGEAGRVREANDAAEMMAALLVHGPLGEREALLHQLVRKVQLHKDRFDVHVAAAGLLGQLKIEGVIEEPIILTTETVKVRHGHEIRLIIPGPQTTKPKPHKRDAKLVKLIAEAHAAKELIVSSGAKSLLRIATDAGRCRTRLGKLVGLSCLAPDIVTAIVEGRQPDALNAKTLIEIDLPVEWKEQRRLLGFA